MSGKVKELKGLKGVGAFHTYHTLLLTYFMSPIAQFKEYETFLSEFAQWSDEEKSKAVKIALTLGEFKVDELMSLLEFEGKTKEELGALSVDEILNAVADVCVEISHIKVFF